MGSLSKFCEQMDYYCRVASVGYDQWERWNVYDGGETDCSALVITCLREAGFDTGDATYTGNMSENLTARGWDRLAPDLSTCKPGDILLNDSSHVAAVIDGYGWDATVAQASIDENGDIHGGQAGDQTGNETNECGMYDYPWDCILRYKDSESGEFEMAEALFYIKDDHQGYKKDDIVYFNTASGFRYLGHPDCVTVLDKMGAIAKIESRTNNNWVYRAAQTLQPSVRDATFGKRA